MILLNNNNTYKSSFKLSTILGLLFFSFHSFAQFSYKIDGIVKNLGKPLSGAVVSIFDFESVKVKEIVTTGTGTFSYALKADEEYTVSITKPGFITMKILYSTIGIEPEQAKKFKGVSTPEIEIFEIPADPQLASRTNELLKKPFLSYYYSADDNKIIGDEVLNQSNQQEFIQILKVVDEPNARAKETAELEANYKAAVTKGDNALAAKNYKAAKEAYNEALALKSAEQYPKKKIAEADKLMADAAAKEKSDKEKATADAAEKERLAKEKAATDAAEKERLAKEKAIADAAAKEKADKDKAAADAAKAEQERLAKEKADAAAEQARLANEKAAAEKAEMDRIAKEKAAANAEQARLAKERADAEKAEQARIAKEKADKDAAEKERLAKEKADAAAAEQARLAAAKEQADKEKAAADAAEKERLAKEAEKNAFEKKYKQIITKGDSAITAKNYPVAKTAFNEALTMKPADEYPKNKLVEIDKLVLDFERFKNDLAKKYPLGVTEEIVKEGNTKVTRRIVVIENKGYLYEKKETSFGSIFYFKDGTAITEVEFNKNTVVK